jgi:hypothetical protein
MTPERMRILKLHKHWADRYLLIWLVFALALLTGFKIFLDHTDVEPADRTALLALLGLIILLSAIWQAAGLAVARVHMIIAGIDFER